MFFLDKNKLNFLSLVLIQASNAVLPVLIFPYILNNVGSALYSKIVIAEIFSIVVLTIVIYGFEIDGVKKVIDAQNNKDGLTVIFSEIFFSRLVLFLASLIVLPIAYFFYGREVFWLVFSWLLVPLSYILQNSYFFLAMQDNFYPACINIANRFFAVSLVYIFVDTARSGYYAPLLIGACYLFGGVANLIYLMKKFRIRLRLIKVVDCVSMLSGSIKIFLSNISVLMLKDLNVFFLSLVTRNPEVITTYSLAEKLVKSFQAIFRPINQFYFPKVALLMRGIEKPNKKAFLNMLRFICVQVTFFLVVLLILFLGYNVFLRYFESIVAEYYTYKATLYLFFIMSFSIIFGIGNFMLGSIGLNLLRQQGYFAISVVVAGAFNMALCIGLSSGYGAIGAAVSFVIAEIVLFGMVAAKYVLRW